MPVTAHDEGFNTRERYLHGGSSRDIEEAEVDEKS
jgi:hypothetical protein